MVKRIAPQARTLNVSDAETLEHTAAALRSLPVRTPA
jgi:hypothetical protein